MLVKPVIFSPADILFRDCVVDVMSTGTSITTNILDNTKKTKKQRILLTNDVQKQIRHYMQKMYC